MAADRKVGGARRGAEYLAASAKITDDGRSRSLCLSLKHDFFFPLNTSEFTLL